MKGDAVAMKRMVYYTNQFFGQAGGEDKAGLAPIVKDGAIGTARALAEMLPEGVVIAGTLICGDNYYSENMEEARNQLLSMTETLQPDLLVAGPAFNAGRFGMACGDLCATVAEALNIPTLTGMYEENPAVAIYRHRTHIVKTGRSAAGMGKALKQMSWLAAELLAGRTPEEPEKAGIFPRGVRVNVFKEKTGAERALDMLLAKVAGMPFETEISLPTYTTIVPAPPLKDLKQAVIALVTTGGIVPLNNPDRLPAATAKHYCVYDISRVEVLGRGAYESVHAGYDPVAANENPNRIVPIDLMRRFEKEGRIGTLHRNFYSTTGNSTSVADAVRMGREIARELVTEGVHGVVMTST